MFGMFPRMCTQAILLMVLIGTIAFCGAKSMEKEPLAVRADIGVVIREDNMMTQMALKYVENLESASQICHFVELSEEEGFAALKKRECVALIVLPEQLIEGIMNGKNPSVEIYFPQDAGLESMLLRELTESGEGLLCVAQAQIYGAYDTAARYGMMDTLSVMQGEIDSYNLAFALDRLAVYDEETVSVSGRMSIVQFYASSAMILFLMLTGMAVYPVMQRAPSVFRKQLVRQGTGEVWQCFCKWFCGFLCMGLMCLLTGVLLWAVRLMFPEVSPVRVLFTGTGGDSHLMARIMSGMMIVVTVSVLIYFIYSLAEGRTAAVLINFLLSVTMLYLSGGLVLSVFLPEAVQAVGGKLPTAYLIGAAGGILGGYHEETFRQSMTGMCCYTLVFGTASYLFRRRGQGK